MKYLIFIASVFLLTACDTQKAPNTSTSPNVAEVKSESTEKAKTHFNQAFSYIGSAKAANGPEREKLFKNAEVEFTNAINIDSNYSEAYMNRGVVYIALNKLNKAEEDLKKSIAINSKNPTAFYNLACLYSLTGKNDLALDSLDSALKNGFNEVERLRSDPDLATLRKSKEFKPLLEKYKFFI